MFIDHIEHRCQRARAWSLTLYAMFSLDASKHEWTSAAGSICVRASLIAVIGSDTQFGARRTVGPFCLVLLCPCHRYSAENSELSPDLSPQDAACGSFFNKSPHFIGATLKSIACIGATFNVIVVRPT